MAGRARLPGVREPRDRRRARPAARARLRAHPGGAGDAVRRHPREERHPLGAQRLRRAPRSRGPHGARARCGPAHGRRRRGPRARGRGAGRRRRRAGGAPRHLPRGDRARRLGSGRQRPGGARRAHGLGGHGLRLLPHRLLGRDLPARGARAGARGAPRLRPRRRSALLPVLGRPHRPHPRLHPPRGRRPPRDPLRGTRATSARTRRCSPPSPSARPSSSARSPRRTARCASIAQPSSGFEDDVGAPQHSHHHHVEGQGAQAPGSNVAACALCDDFCTGLCRLEAQHEHGHGHGHHHHPYPHADHPLGPESVRRPKA